MKNNNGWDQSYVRFLVGMILACVGIILIITFLHRLNAW